MCTSARSQDAEYGSNIFGIPRFQDLSSTRHGDSPPSATSATQDFFRCHEPTRSPQPSHRCSSQPLRAGDRLAPDEEQPRTTLRPCLFHDGVLPKEYATQLSFLCWRRARELRPWVEPSANPPSRVCQRLVTSGGQAGLNESNTFRTCVQPSRNPSGGNSRQTRGLALYEQKS